MEQITEKCSSDDLRKKILKTGDKMTLDDIISEANALEVIERQLGNFGGKKLESQEVNKIITRRERNQDIRKRAACSRCGSTNHFARDSKCPAKTKSCHKCGIIGHFQRQCRTRDGQKRKSDREEETHNKDLKKFKRNIEETANVASTSKQFDYIFNVNTGPTVSCEIGGTEVNMLIDSGCNHNLITDRTWQFMKRSNSNVTNQNKNPQKKFVAYGSGTPLKLLGAFDADIKLGKRLDQATFYVISGGTRNLLGKITATSLGVLQINIPTAVNNVEWKAFPKFKDVLVEIPIDKSIKPVAQPYRRIPIPLEVKVEDKIKELLQKDIIEEVKGPSNWVSPIVPVLKDNGEVRLCVDMRRANVAIKRENHPLPTMDQLLPKMREAKLFTKLDIQDAFHHIELHPDSRPITTFITGKGLFRFKRMMFGITCAPEIFQKTLERILLGCDGVINFIDDILVFGKDKMEHDDRLEKVLKVLDSYNVVLNKEKCIYRARVVKFLGHELSESGVRPLDKYLSAIKNFRAPATISELQSFLGLVNFVGKWIPHLATTTEPLKELLRQKAGRNSDITGSWNEARQAAFNKLKASLVDISCLGYYNPKDKTTVIADASPVGLGAVLIQTNDEGSRIIAYGNKTLTECERRYCQTEKEALALVWAIEHFNMFLYGKDFDLVTDHKPLETIFGPKSKPCARIERWVLRLQCYRFNIKYSPGKNNIADPLSRL
ncbi:jg24389, partial [Pararge aegeria aegeria]